MTFGRFLKTLREKKDLKIRELARLSQQDPAYVYRLEEGEKSSPSEAVIKSLIRSLRLNEREAHVLGLLAEREIDENLINLVLNNDQILLVDFESASRASFRESPPRTEEEWLKYLQKIREAREEIERG